LIRAVSNELLFDVDQYGEHSDGRSIKERGNEPLAVIKKCMPNRYSWRTLQRGICKEECNRILVEFTRTSNKYSYYYTSPRFPDYIIRR
jgi:hypothetical protein